MRCIVLLVMVLQDGTMKWYAQRGVDGCIHPTVHANTTSAVIMLCVVPMDDTP